MVKSTSESPRIAANDRGLDAKEDSALTHSDDTTRGARAIETVYNGYRFRSRRGRRG